MAKKSTATVDPNPVLDPQAVTIQELDDLDYAAGAAPGSTVTPEAPPTPVEVALETEPTPAQESPEVQGQEKVAAEETEGEPVPIAGVEAETESEPPAIPIAEVASAKTPEETLKELQANQVAHYQKLYEDLKKELDEIKAKTVLAEPAAEVAVPKPPTPEEIRRHYEPEMEKVVNEGYLSREFVDDYPTDVAQMLYHRDILYNLTKQVNELATWANSTVGQQRNMAAESHLNSLMDKVAEKGVHFQPLKDPEVRQAFRGYLNQVNPMCNAQNVEEVISQQYLAFNHQAVLAALTGGAAVSPNPAPGASAPAVSAPQRNLAMGEHGGTRPGSPAQAKVDPFLAEMDALDL